MNKYIVIMITVMLAWSVLLGRDSTTLILKNADYNHNSFYDSSLISYFKGNVEFHYDSMKIFSDEAIWRRDDGIGEFWGKVYIINNKRTFDANRIILDQNKETLTATGQLEFFDSTDNIKMNSDRGVYEMKENFLTLSENPILYHYDTTTAETLSIAADNMTYDDSLNIAIGTGQTHVHKGKLDSWCDKATYFADSGIVFLRHNPKIVYDIHELKGDSIDLFFKEDKIKGISVMRNAFGLHQDINKKRDTVFTKAHGDSIYMAISDSGEVENIWTYRDAKTFYYSTESPALVNKAKGEKMILDFHKGSTGKVTIEGNAVCTYYVEDKKKKEQGRNESSGDKIQIYFKNGETKFIKMLGSVKGTWFSESYQKK